MCLGWCCNSSTGTPAWSQEMASSSYVFTIVRSLSWIHAYRFLGISFAPGCHFTLKTTPAGPLIPFITPYLHSSSNLIPHVPIPTHPYSTHKISFLSPSQGDPCIPPSISTYCFLIKPLCTVFGSSWNLKFLMKTLKGMQLNPK